MIGSANFTASGMTRRTEMSVYFNDSPEVDEAKTWFDKLWDTGTIIDPDALEKLISELPKTPPDNWRPAVSPAGDERNISLGFLPELLYYQSARGYHASNGQFCVKKGSFAKRTAMPLEKHKLKYYQHRDRLIKTEILVQEEEYMSFKFVQDTLFGSPSEAASIVDGNSRTGSVWTVK